MDSRISARSLETALGGWRTREPAYEALADGIRLLCLDNRIAARTLLPAERNLAQTLRVSRTTVANAYSSLRASGHIRSLRGSGSVTVALEGRSDDRVSAAPGAIDLQQASPAAWPGVAGLITEASLDAARLVSRVGYDTRGSSALREAIAARYRTRGIDTSPDEILVTTGAQSAIHLLAGVLVRRGDRVLVETPTYPHAADALRGAGARMVTVPVTTDGGWDLARAAEAFDRTRPSVAYLMPTFHNPTGRTMSPREVEVIAQAARRMGCRVIVDETTAELAFGDAPDLPWLGHDAIRIGSLGKTVWGGLRVGWIRADEESIRTLRAARPARDLGTPEFEQAIATAAVERLDSILPQRGELLRAGHAALAGALADLLPQWRVPEVAGGVALWVGLPEPLSSALVLAARVDDVYLTAGPRFGVDGGHEARLRLPFTATPAELVRAVEVLAKAWERVRAGVPSPSLPAGDALV